MKDILYLDRVMSYKTKKELICNYFCWLYPFTNENINGYYSQIDFKDKKILTVTSSGDHALNAFVNGAKNVTTFDSNPLAKYYSELKVAGIKTLDLEEFLLFFYNKNLFREQEHYLNKKVYKNYLREVLDDDNKNFWDYVFNFYDYKELYKSSLFSYDFLSKKGLFEANKYLDSKDYILLRKILENKKIDYYDYNINNLNKINNKFDLILLSNIIAFINDENTLERLKHLKNIFNNIINDNGNIVFNYYYSNLLHSKNKNLVYNFNELEDILKEYKHEILTFESSVNLDRNKIFRNYLSKDKVLILKK